MPRVKGSRRLLMRRQPLTRLLECLEYEHHMITVHQNVPVGTAELNKWARVELITYPRERPLYAHPLISSRGGQFQIHVRHALFLAFDWYSGATLLPSGQLSAEAKGMATQATTTAPAEKPRDPYPFHPAPTQPALAQAHRILMAANMAASNFWFLWDIFRSDKPKGGTSSDSEQDLLRAMLVFACAGLDSMIKQIVQDALPLVIERDSSAREQLVRYAESRIGHRDGTSGDLVLDHRLLTRLLLAPSPQAGFIQQLVQELTADSLQSKTEIMKVSAFFGLEPKLVCPDPHALDATFKVRNRIIHEMDVNLTGRTRKRTSRTLKEMQTSTKLILDVGAAFLREVDRKLSPSLQT